MQELVPGEKLHGLLVACETYCVAACCGLDAFDLSPLNMAYHFSRYVGQILVEDVKTIEDDLDRLLEESRNLKPEKHDFICIVKHTNSCFTKQQLQEFVDEIKTNLHRSVEVLEMSEKIRFKK